MTSLRSIAGVSALAVLLPLQTLAAFSSTSSLFSSMMEDKTPHDFSAEVHAQVEKYYAALWAKGSFEGQGILDEKLQESATLDIASPADGVKVRAKMQLIIKNQALYLHIDSLEGTVDTKSITVNSSIGAKPWIVIPFDPVTLQSESGMSMDTQKQLILKIVDAIFTTQNKKYQGGTEYDLSLKPDFLEQLNTVITQTSPEMAYAGEDLPKLQEWERMLFAHSTMSTKLFFDVKNISIGTYVDIAVSLPEEKIFATLKLSSTKHSGALNLTAPAGAVPFETFMETVGNEFSQFDQLLPSYDPYLGLPIDPYSSSSDSSDGWDYSSESSVPALSPGCNLSDLRKGLCGVSRPAHN